MKLTKKKAGRKPALSPDQIEQVIELKKQNPDVSAQVLIEHMGLSVCRVVIYKIWNDAKARGEL